MLTEYQLVIWIPINAWKESKRLSIQLCLILEAMDSKIQV
jgi:hypothetical protein